MLRFLGAHAILKGLKDVNKVWLHYLLTEIKEEEEL